jgi:hypothetical protein
VDDRVITDRVLRAPEIEDAVRCWRLGRRGLIAVGGETGAATPDGDEDLGRVGVVDEEGVIRAVGAPTVTAGQTTS